MNSHLFKASQKHMQTKTLMAWDSFRGIFALKMEISGARWKKKIKRWHLFTWHMVPGLEGVCGGVERTVYGALGHLGSSPHTAIQSRRQPVCCFNCPRTPWPIWIEWLDHIIYESVYLAETRCYQIGFSFSIECILFIQRDFLGDFLFLINWNYWRR